MWKLFDSMPWWGKLIVVGYLMVAFRIAMVVFGLWLFLSWAFNNNK